MVEVKTMLKKKKIPAKTTIRRSIAFPRKALLSFSTLNTLLRIVLKELNTHVEVQIKPPILKTPTILR
jgi:hypothetical protein